MSSRNSSIKKNLSKRQEIVLEAKQPALYVIPKDRILRLKESNPHIHFALALLYFSLFFSCGLGYLLVEKLNNFKLVILVFVSIMTLVLFLLELQKCRMKMKVLDKILDEMMENEATILG
jgi:hypothetical protein